MKVAVIQPKYSTDIEDAEALFAWELEALARVDADCDIIVLPEATDVPAFAKSYEDFIRCHELYTDRILAAAAECAVRCHSMLFINALCETEDGLANTTYAFDREGNITGKYYKVHPTNGEVFKRALAAEYSYRHESPTVLEMEGIRFAFLTCYDFYFYEQFPAIARVRPDIIIGASHQRTDLQSALRTMTAFLAYNTNSYVLRASVSMGEDSEIGGGSMVATPKGEIVLDMASRVGIEYCEIDPTEKYLKPAGFGGALMPHHEYIEVGRRPWRYRPAGSAVCLPDDLMGYPRLCAHRGWKTVCPENSMPAFGAAVAIGAEEIEFDLWQAGDGSIVSIHDSRLERVSDGEGFIWDYTLEELSRFDFGKGFEGKFRGLRILTFENILKKLACHTVMNIHIKSKNNTDPLPEDYLSDIVDTIRRYDCERYVYFMTGNDTVNRQLARIAPDIERCVGGGNDPWHIVERAIELGCKKVQLMRGKYTQESIALAKEHGIRLNIFWSDDPTEARALIESGIDTVLTNDVGVMRAELEDLLATRANIPANKK